MRKHTKIILVIAGACLAMGFMLMAFTYAIIGGDMSRINTGSKFEKKEYEISQSKIDNLVVDIKSNEVEIIGTDTDKIHITYYENDTQKYEISDADKTLNFRQVPDRKIRLFQINLDFESYKIRIEMPQKLAGELKIDNKSGSVDLENLNIGKDIIANISSGSLRADKVTTNQNMSVMARSGSVKANDILVKEDAKLDLSSGALTIQNFEAKNVETNISSGDVHLSNVKAEDKIKCDANSGTMSIDKLDAGKKIDISSESGSIRGSIVGEMSDFTIHTTVASGNSNLPESMEGGSKQLDINARSGNIKIEFSEVD